MKVQKKETAPRYMRNEGITSYLLASPITTESEYLTTSFVVIEPGGHQRIHSHELKQVYFFIEGNGKMQKRSNIQDFNRYGWRRLFCEFVKYDRYYTCP